ncbi:hypothetical protein QTP70_019660, partial [Hemibagrus guttatus]
FAVEFCPFFNKPHPVQTVSFLDPGLMCDDATQTDNAVSEVLTKPPSHHLHFYTSGLCKTVRYSHFSDSGRC